MYPDRDTCEKRIHLIQLQLETLREQQRKVENYISSLEKELKLCHDTIDLQSMVGGRAEIDD